MRLHSPLLGFLLTITAANGALAAVDDCQSIRNQLDLASSGTVVTIPAGDYTCASPLILDRDGVILRGETKNGKSLVTLKLADHANAPLVVIGQATTPPSLVRGITVRDLVLDGNMQNQDMECWGGPCDSGGTTYIRNNGITVRGAHESYIENVRAFHARSGGLVTERGVRGLMVSNFEAHDNFFDGLAGYETERSVFSGLYLHENRYAGISIDINFNQNLILNSRLIKNGDVGIFARWSTGNLFRNLLIEDSGNHGIFLSHDGEAAHCPFNYSFNDVEVRGSKYWGLWLNNDVCTGTKIENSRFRGNKDGCVFVPNGGSIAMSGVTCE